MQHILNSTMDPYGFTRRMKVARRNSHIPRPVTHFIRKSIRREFHDARFGGIKIHEGSSIQSKNRKRLKKLALSNEKVWEREKNRDPVECDPLLMYIYYTLCFSIDIVYKDNPIERFWFLETVARMPYFSYITVLHFYETMGWWSIDNKLREAHNKEDINEGNHLMIMESLGGGVRWVDKFLARHAAIVYYLALIPLYLFSPRTAYKSSELLELHAVDTYTQFVDQNKELLIKLPASVVAQNCYGNCIINLYEVFWLISSDERKHAKSMRVLSNP
jgi:ubiquinol oxidase